jgi:hypothetical protein
MLYTGVLPSPVFSVLMFDDPLPPEPPHLPDHISHLWLAPMYLPSSSPSVVVPLINPVPGRRLPASASRDAASACAPYWSGAPVAVIRATRRVTPSTSRNRQRPVTLSSPDREIDARIRG